MYFLHACWFFYYLHDETQNDPVLFSRIAGKQGTRETLSFSLALQECDTQGSVWVEVALMRKEKQADSLGLCGKKVRPGIVWAGEAAASDTDKWFNWKK